MLQLWRNKKATGSATGDVCKVAADRPAGDLHPSPHPSPKGASQKLHPDAAAQYQDGSGLSAVPSKEKTPSKATLKWRRNQARSWQLVSV
jgi:hypothetical protein